MSACLLDKSFLLTTHRQVATAPFVKTVAQLTRTYMAACSNKGAVELIAAADPKVHGARLASGVGCPF